MKKRILVLLLVLSILCALTGCDGNDESVTPKEYGEFYTEDGIMQNTKITITIDNEDLTVPIPIKELSYTLYEKCDFSLKVVDYAGGNECRDLIEVYQDGVWMEAPRCGNGGLSVSGYVILGGDYAEYDTFQRKMSFHDKEEAHYLCYMPLQPGQYRLRVKYAVEAADENVEIPKGQLEAVAYFTVTAPVE